MTHYEDMTEYDLLVEDFLHIISTDDGQERFDISGKFQKKLKDIIGKKDRAEKALSEIRELTKSPNFLARTIHVEAVDILDTYFGGQDDNR